MEAAVIQRLIQPEGWTNFELIDGIEFNPHDGKCSIC